MDTGILVTGLGEASAAPDVLRVQLRVSCDRTDVSGALSAAADRASQVLAALRELGLSDRQLQTTSVDVHTRYGRNETVVGYRASHGLVATCPDLTMGGRVLTAAASAGGNDLSVDRITMEIADTGPLKVRARERAFIDARERAEAFAAMCGRPLGVLEFLEEHDDRGLVPRIRASAYLTQPAGDSSMPMEGGEQTVRVQVTVRWALAGGERP